MVDSFIVFNEKSLPLTCLSQLDIFFKIITGLSKLKISTIRIEKPIQQYVFYDNKYIQELFRGTLLDSDKKSKIRSFIANRLVILETPNIKEDEENSIEQDIVSEYMYKGSSIDLCGIIVAYIFDTVLISIESSNDWSKNHINISINNKIVKQVKNISNDTNFQLHEEFLITKILGKIAQSDFFIESKCILKKITLHNNTRGQIGKLNGDIFKSVVKMIYEWDIGKCTPIFASESSSVRDDPTLRGLREFTIDGSITYCPNHIKKYGLRIYFYIDSGNHVHIVYIGEHLPTKKYD